MTAAAKKKTPKEFDQTKLSALTEPISLYISRAVGNKQQPIDLPVKQGEAYPGKGWTQDDILQLPNFLATKWTGGGLYNCKATGDNGETMEWDIYFPPNQIPERQPPTMGATPIIPIQVAQPGAAAPSWMDHAAQQYQQPQQQVPMTYMPSFNPYVQPPAGYGPTPAPYGGLLQGSGYFGSRLGHEDNRYQQEREARLSMEAKFERERLQSNHQQQIEQLRHEVQQTRESFVRRPSDDESPALRAANQQIAMLQQQQQQNSITAMIAANQQQTQQLLAEMRSSTQQQIAELRAALSAKPAGPDPMVMMMIESSKLAAEAQRAIASETAKAQIEVARLQADAQREAARNGFGPQHMIDLISRAGAQTEHLGKAYAGAMELMQQGVETVLNMQQPSMHPALEMVGQAAQGGLGILQQYVAGKQQTDQVQAQAQAQVAQSAVVAQMQQDRMRSQQQLAGAPPGTQPAVAANQPSAVAAGKRDEAAYFGPAWTAVQQFRSAVSTGTVAPPMAAQGIVQAINHFATNGKAGQVAAFDLWRKGELAELVDALLPGAPTSYREQTTQSLFQLLQQLRAQQGGAKPSAVQN